MSYKNEKELIFDLIDFNHLKSERIRENLLRVDLQWVLGALLFNRVGGIAYYSLERVKLLRVINREFRNALKCAYEYAIHKNREYSIALQELAEVLKKADFPHAVLKGPYLIYDTYDEGLRTSNDYDILINQRDIDSCNTLLHQAGYRQRVYDEVKGYVSASRKEILISRMNNGELIPYSKEGRFNFIKHIEVDINISLDFKGTENNAYIDQILENTFEFQIGSDSSISILCLQEFFLHLCSHLYKEATTYFWVKRNRDVSLYKFCDIYAFIEKYFNTKFIDKLLTKAVKYNLKKPLYYTLYNTVQMFPSLNENPLVAMVIDGLCLSDTSFLREILRPSDNKVFSYDMDFPDWVFCQKKIDFLM